MAVRTEITASVKPIQICCNADFSVHQTGNSVIFNVFMFDRLKVSEELGRRIHKSAERLSAPVHPPDAPLGHIGTQVVVFEVDSTLIPYLESPIRPKWLVS